MLLLCYPRCTTCQKAKKWLDENKIKYEDRDIAVNNPNQKEYGPHRFQRRRVEGAAKALEPMPYET